MKDKDVRDEVGDLCLGRKAGQSVTFNTSDGAITVSTEKGTRLRIRCPKAIHIVRTELLEDLNVDCADS